MVPLGFTHIHDARTGDVLLCLCRLNTLNYRAPMDANHCIVTIGLNLFDVTRCNGLQHKKNK